MAHDEEVCHDCFHLDLERSPFAVVSTIAGVARREATIHVPFGSYEPHTKKCGYCALIRTAIQACVPEYTGRPNAYLHLASITMIRGEPLLLTCEDWSASADDEGARFGVEVFRDQGMVVPGLEWLGGVQMLTARKGRKDWWMGFVKEHLEVCETKHDLCRKPEGKLPTRVLDLGEQSVDDEADLRLVCTDTSRQGRYVALSHCWGPDGIDFTLEESSYERLQEKIQFVDLPPTHQDAVVTTRRLGIRYLWIDSLCIIQDNVVDAQRETAVMDDIYARAYLTIAAVSSTNSRMPFVETGSLDRAVHKVAFHGSRTRSSLRSLLGKVSGSSRPSKVTLCARRTQRTAAKENDSASRTTAAGLSDAVIGPLSKRAWTLQERALASRVVHFTSEGLRFECPTLFKTEDGRTSTPGYLSRWQYLENFHGKTSRSAEGPRDELQRFWRRMLSDYAQRGITRRSDRLPALSGLAARLQKIHGAEYVAGLWRDRLVQDLCWSVQNVKRLYHEALPILEDEASLPTWAWVSVQSPTVYSIIDEQGTFTTDCDVLECQITLAGKGLNPFGQVTSGQLLLRGLVRRARLRVSGTRTFDVDFGLGSNSSLEPDATLTCHPDESEEKHWRRAVEGEDVTQGEAEVLCLKLGTWTPDYSTTHLSSTSLGFVMVLGQSRRVEGAYERLGLLDKTCGVTKFEDTEGTVGLMRRIDEFHAFTAKFTGVNLTHSRPKADQDWWEKKKEEPAYPAAEVMDVRIV